MKLLELKQEHKAALDKAEAALGGRDHVMTKAETEIYDEAMSRAEGICPNHQAAGGHEHNSLGIPGRYAIR